MILLLLAMLSAQPGAIEADVRGTADPLAVQLLVEDEDGQWQEVRQLHLAAETRHLRFGDLAAGVYQILLRGSDPTEQLAVRIPLDDGETRRTTILVEPLTLAGHVTHAGNDLGSGAIELQQQDGRWRAPIALADDGTFLVQLWQRGTFLVTVHAPSLDTPYTDTVQLHGASRLRVTIDVPGDGGTVAVQLARR